MDKRFIQVAGILGALAVILGAFGAHALKNILSEKNGRIAPLSQLYCHRYQTLSEKPDTLQIFYYPLVVLW